ncbi:hypothetical protein KKA47_01910 [bacterium]|nr:hypothetical protein [bacterium]
MDTIITRYNQAQSYIDEGLIRQDPINTRSGREWMEEFVIELGNPQLAYPAVHVAGTSGKGTTSFMIANTLFKAGLNVGFHQSPFLQVATEKLWFNGKYASIDEFEELVNWIKPICEKWRSPEVPLHGLASFGIALEYFKRKNADIVVIETGVGGRDDVTNILNTKLSVITNIGYDHLKVLGTTIEDIAKHKAGIIKHNVPVVTTLGPGLNIIRNVANDNNARLEIVDTSHTLWSVNAQMAKTSCYVLRDLGYNISDDHIENGIKTAAMPGRFETVSNDPLIILDGAHNPDKMKYLAIKIMSKGIKDATLIYGSLASRDAILTLNPILPYCKNIIITEPDVYGKPSHSVDELFNLLNGLGKRIIRTNEPMKAIEYALTNKMSPIVVTGSLYLVGQLRNRWYPEEKILEQRTSKPI